MASDETFHRFSHEHQDLVLAVDYNFYGTRMATASSDQHLRVWDRDPKDGKWSVTAKWSAHDAEITGVKWNGPFVGEILASIGEDGMLRIWQESPTKDTHAAGERFRCIYAQNSASQVPYMSLDFKNIGNETYLAMVSRDGQLTVCEPVDHDDLSEWQIMWQDYLCKIPSRTCETGFSVCWHKEKLPAWPAILAGLDRKCLTLAVAVMDTVKVFRTNKDRKFYTAAELTGAKTLIRDVAWANGSMRGYDLVATASKDGHVRLYELHTHGGPAKFSIASVEDAAEIKPVATDAHAPSGGVARPGRSGIRDGLAGTAKVSASQEEEAKPGRVVQDARLVAEIYAHDGAVWRISFSQMGDLLISTGDDGLVQVWKKGVNDQWMQYAEIDGTKDA